MSKANTFSLLRLLLDDRKELMDKVLVAAAIMRVVWLACLMTSHPMQTLKRLSSRWDLAMIAHQRNYKNQKSQSISWRALKMP